jgi:hypothetical protein
VPLVLGAITLFVATGLFGRRLGALQQVICLGITVGFVLTYLALDGIS